MTLGAGVGPEGMSGVWLAQSHAAANKVPYSEKTPMREATKQPVMSERRMPDTPLRNANRYT
jgi:hypothetical protein